MRRNRLRAFLILMVWAIVAFSAPALALTFTQIDFPGAEGTSVIGINRTGQIVGYFTAISGDHGFLLDAGAFTQIDRLGSSGTYAAGINNAGQNRFKIVGSFYEGDWHGFVRDTKGVITAINYPGAIFTIASGINTKEQMVGQATDGATTWGYVAR
jgi:probable HAF family extracellular repeat protein